MILSLILLYEQKTFHKELQTIMSILLEHVVVTAHLAVLTRFRMLSEYHLSQMRLKSSTVVHEKMKGKGQMQRWRLRQSLAKIQAQDAATQGG